VTAPDDLAQRARAVQLLTCDVDGVLTDGRVYVDDDGRETKAFHALDGVGIKRLAEAGITVAWITGSPSDSVVHRARRLGVEHVFRGSDDKLPAWERLCATLGVAPSACAHIGDDLPDVPLMRASVLAATVPHAPDAVKRHAHYVTRREGGFGAVRELAELILGARGRA
jgi:3-deoxy-D-manno-octulosonate 8-phosphate phosphatase (KDO 8-P phosphatase)